MQPGLKWRWSYLPVILVIALIWYEFWASGALKDAAAPLAQSQSQPQTQTAQAATDPAITAIVPSPELPPLLPVKVIDPFDRLLKDPPPISLTVQNATFKQTIDALNTALGGDASITFNGASQNNKLITLDLKDQPFWDVFEALQSQTPFDIQDNGRGMMVRQGGQGIRHFQRKGAAMIYATQFTYTRNISGQAQPGETAQPHMQLTLITVIDPRVHVTRHSSMSISAIDDNGITIDVGDPNGSVNWMPSESNCWQQTLAWPAPDKPAKKMTKISCLCQFTAVGGEAVSTLEDIENKKDQTFDFGDRRLRLAQCETVNDRMTLQVTAADEMPLPPQIVMTVTDGKGAPIANIHGLDGRVIVTNGPYKLTLKGPRSKDVTLSIDLEDVPLP